MEIRPSAPTAARVDALIGPMLEDSHELAPNELPEFIEGRLRACDFDDAVIYITDHEQRLLVPLSPRGSHPTLEVDTTGAGRAYQSAAPVDVAVGGSRQLWLPLRDGVERLGVLGVRAARFDDDLMTACMHVASVTAQLLVSKGQFTDQYQTLRRTRSMALGAELRWHLLPPISFSCDRVNVAAGLEPAYEVAGDAFDYALNDDVLHVAIFDGVGHDLEAARLTDLVLGSYRHCRRRALPLLDTYHEMDSVVSTSFGVEHFVTAQLATIDVKRGAVQLVNAGHPGPLLQRRGRLVPVRPPSIVRPLGIGTGEAATSTIALERGDRLLFYTDGLTDALAPDGSRFGERRLADTIERACNETHLPSEAIRRLLHSFVSHRGATWRDDATVVMVEWRGSGGGGEPSP